MKRSDWRAVLTDECMSLGGVYVKFLQMLAIHQHTKQWVASSRIYRVFEDVPFESIDVVKELVEARIAHHFSHINQNPMAAGSYGQVYQATLTDGELVVVKVLRPTVEQYIKIDLRIIGVVAWVASLFARGSMVHPYKMFREFATATLQETDYIAESHNGEWLRGHFAASQSIVIPKSYTALTTTAVLVQEYVPGVSLAASMDAQRKGIDVAAYVQQHTGGSDIWQQLATLGTELLAATLNADYIMADPHPGNVRLLPNNQVALIDFGLVAKAPANREAFADVISQLRLVYEDSFQAGNFAGALLAFYDEDLSSALRCIAQTEGRDYKTILQQYVDKEFQASQGVGTAAMLRDRRSTAIFMNVLNANNSLGIHLNEKDAVLQRSMYMFLSMVRNIGEQCTGNPHLRVVHQALTAVDGRVSLAPNRATKSVSYESSLELVNSWLAWLAETNRALYTTLTRSAL